MSLWREDFATSSLQEIIERNADNKAWNKELRRNNSSLVNRRIAHEISFDAYIMERNLLNGETAECRRRATILDAQMTRCMLGSRPLETLRMVSG
jgi:hypothetical protein